MNAFESLVQAIKTKMNDATVLFMIGNAARSRNAQNRRIIFIRQGFDLEKSNSFVGNARSVLLRREKIEVRLYAAKPVKTTSTIPDDDDNSEDLDNLFENFATSTEAVLGPNYMPGSGEFIGGSDGSGVNERQACLIYTMVVNIPVLPPVPTVATIGSFAGVYTLTNPVFSIPGITGP